MKNQSTYLFQIFRAGTHVAMSGVPIRFSESDIDMMAAVYNPKRHAAPLVLGHPTSNEPVYGKTAQLVAMGDHLFASANVGDALIQLVRSGHYKYVSAAFFAPKDPANPVPGAYYLRHVGFLGALPPALKGMRPPAFAEEHEPLTFALDALGANATFAESPLSTPVPAFRGPQGYAVDMDRLNLHRAAVAYCEAVPGLSYIEAVEIVSFTRTL